MAKSTISTPHDTILKRIIPYPEMAWDFLEIHFPIVLREVYDLQTLKLKSTSSTKQDLRACYPGVVWLLKTREGLNYVYCTTECQSTAVPYMAFRLMRYATVTMQYYLDVGNRTLPLVIPTLFYHSQQNPHPWSLNWLGEFDNPQLARQLYSEAFPLIDITVMPNGEITQYRRAALLELMQEYIRDHDLMGPVDRLVLLLVTSAASDSQLRTLSNYLIRHGDASCVSEFTCEVAERFSQHREKLMTIIGRLRQGDHQNGL